MEISGRAGKRRFEIVGVTDDLGFTPVIGPYRNGKTYGVIDAADADLIAPYAEPLGAAAVVAHGDAPRRAALAGAGSPRRHAGHALLDGRVVPLAAASARRTSDFVIFDLMLFAHQRARGHRHRQPAACSRCARAGASSRSTACSG